MSPECWQMKLGSVKRRGGSSKCQNPGQLPLQQCQSNRHLIESRQNHRPPPPPKYSYHPPPPHTKYLYHPPPPPAKYLYHPPPPPTKYPYPPPPHPPKYPYPPPLLAGYHQPPTVLSWLPLPSNGGQYYPPSIGQQPQPNCYHCQPPYANLNSSLGKYPPTVHHPTSNGCKRRHLCIEDGTPQQHEDPGKRQHPPKQCDYYATKQNDQINGNAAFTSVVSVVLDKKLRGNGQWRKTLHASDGVYTQLHHNSRTTNQPVIQSNGNATKKTRKRRAEETPKYHDALQNWAGHQNMGSENTFLVTAAVLKQYKEEERSGSRKKVHEAVAKQLANIRKDRELKRLDKQRADEAVAEQLISEKIQADLEKREADRRQCKSEENMKMIARQHEESEEREAERQRKHEQAIHEIDDLMVLNEIGAIRTKRFTINSQHKWIINLKSISDIESIPRLDGIMKASILESIGQVIGPSKTISIIDTSPSKSGKSATVTYQVIPCLTDNDQKTIEEFESVEEIRVAPYDLSSSSFDIRYHLSLRPHIIKHGLAMLALLQYRNSVRALKKPSKEKAYDIVSNAIGAGGMYTAWDIYGTMKDGSTKKFDDRVTWYKANPKS